MPSYNRTPAYNLQIVVHETGLTPDTLRVWEKRYNLPQPQRSSGGHRLYSEYDIETLRWLVARRDEGLSISRAAALWHELEAQGRDPLEVNFKPPEQLSRPMVLATGEALARVRQSWIATCLAFNEEAAERELAQAFALYPPDTVCLEILQNGLSEIGEMWYRGEATVQQEHFASDLAMRRLHALVAALPQPTRTEHILIGCPPGEEHSFAALLLALLFRRQGWRVTYLGANMPLDKLAETLAVVRPHLVVMSAQHLQAAAALLEVATLLKAEQVPLAFGGNIFNQIPTLSAQIPGHFLGATQHRAVQQIDRLLTSRPPLPLGAEIPTACRRALEHYQARQTFIEAAVYQNEISDELSPAQLAAANRDLAGNILAALALGDIHFADAALAWLVALLRHQRIATLPLRRYLRAYLQAATANLGEAGTPIIRWLQGWANSQAI
jgi:DNA-binding transcriptional MerR regulator/methylmalonyl-CoA mutase cobalamin-binding subunit